MKIIFVTSNPNKLREARAVLSSHEIEQADIDLPEIQAVELEDVAKQKARLAAEKIKKPVIVEDTGLFLECLGGLPGALTKWFLKRLGCRGLSKLVLHYDSNRAEARTVVAYCEPGGAPHIFFGSTKGTIVSPRVESDFGWDPIFVPCGHYKSFAEMAEEERLGYKMRTIALKKLEQWLDEK